MAGIFPPRGESSLVCGPASHFHRWNGATGSQADFEFLRSANRSSREGNPMLKLTFSAIAGLLLALVLNTAGPAQAQTPRVFVGALGSNSNPCTFAAPCRTFQHAHDTVTAGGEINVLDPAGYGSVTINKSISIQAHGFAGITVGSGATAITITGTDVTVNLRGLIIEGAGVGSAGISFLGSGTLNVQGCVIRNLLDGGLGFLPSGASRLFVTDTLIAEVSRHDPNFGSAALAILNFSSGSSAIMAVLNRVS